jgi:hypothetical protein
MLTAREMISPSVTSEITACPAISTLARLESGSTSVGLNAVAVVNESAR